ncbi:hypothetical protein ACH33_09340 [Aneurinibacillus sp. XH2]|uniref:homoserine dehydrogenase n=1 Tax=Aneurinibacillus sp. XH2 TaxID=1450761 RepID=UPI00071071DF|nr:homoserine dehydrogenase [Aneurinibacillus sp. XH2]AMA73044.1 hypothetical protein ACH33_09340 [Aneurinibacillus sp. XH2]
MKTWKIALLGLGTVGSGVMTILHTHATRIEKQAGVKFEVVGVLVRDVKKPRRVKVKRELLTTEIETIWEKNPEIVIDAMGGISPALGYIEQAIERKCHVVSANKEMIAAYGTHLHRLADKNGVSLLYEASVGGGIPILNALSQLLKANRITRVYGILNGTTNYILTKMEEEGLTYQEALEQAQEFGFAEADPTADVEGYDAFNKIQIIANLCFGPDTPVLEQEREGIASITGEEMKVCEKLAYRIKLLASAERTDAGCCLRVVPTLVPYAHPLSGVKNECNGVFITGDVVGDVSFTGKGAGALPTGSAIVEDMLNIVRGWTFTPDKEGLMREDVEQSTGVEKVVLAFFTFSKQTNDSQKIRLISFLSGGEGFLHAVETVSSGSEVHVAAVISNPDVYALKALADDLQAELKLRPVLDERLSAAREDAAVLVK